MKKNCTKKKNRYRVTRLLNDKKDNYSNLLGFLIILGMVAIAIVTILVHIEYLHEYNTSVNNSDPTSAFMQGHE